MLDSRIAKGNLNGTTLRVYRYLFRQGGKSVGIHEVQSALGLSSPSVAHYHIRKLVEEGLVKEGSNGYLVEAILFENMIRVKKSLLPIQLPYLVLFLLSLLALLVFFDQQTISGVYPVSIASNIVAVSIFAWETIHAFRLNSRMENL
jgi:predicted DNA-binding transcriptional regulator